MKGETKRRNADKPFFDNPHEELAYHRKRAGIAQATADQLRSLLKVANQDSSYHRNMVQKYQHQIDAVPTIKYEWQNPEVMKAVTDQIKPASKEEWKADENADHFED